MTDKQIMRRISVTLRELGYKKMPADELDYYKSCIHTNVVRNEKSPTKQLVEEKTLEFCVKYL